MDFKQSLNSFFALWAVLATIAVAVLMCRLGNRVKEIRRLEGNQSALTGEVQRYRTESDKSAASVEALQLELSEYRALAGSMADEVGDLKRVISELRLKERRIKALSSAVTETVISEQTEFHREPFQRDTLTLPKIEPPVMAASSGIIEWSDPWVSLRVRVAGGDAQVEIHSRDTLYQIVHRVPKRFLCIPYCTKAIRQEIVSSNPHTHIVYTRYIELK